MVVTCLQKIPSTGKETRDQYQFRHSDRWYKQRVPPRFFIVYLRKIHTYTFLYSNIYSSPRKLTWLAGKSTVNDDGISYWKWGVSNVMFLFRSVSILYYRWWFQPIWKILRKGFILNKQFWESITLCFYTWICIKCLEKSSKSYSPKWWWNMVSYYSREWTSHLRKKNNIFNGGSVKQPFYVMTWNHPIKTSIYKWLFGVPGLYIYTSSGKSNGRCPKNAKVYHRELAGHFLGSRLALGGPRSP